MASTDEAPRPSARPYLAIPAALLVLIAGWEVVATVRAEHSVPGDAAWAAAGEAVRAGYQRGDLIVFAPAWADPVGRLHLGDLISIDDAARMDAAKYGRIWEVSIRGAHAPEVAGLAPVAISEHDGVTVRRFERAPAIVLADLRDRLSTVRSVGGARAPTLELAEVGFAPHRCIQVVPRTTIAAGLVFPKVPLGRELVGYVGISDVFTRRDQRWPAGLTVEIDGRLVASAIAGVEDGWVRFAAPTTPGVGDITIIASSQGENRLVCFALETRQ